MKALASGPLALVLPLLALASACASSSTLPEMPAHTRDVTAAQGPLLHDEDDSFRVPRDEVVPDTWPARGLYLGGALISAQPLGDLDGETALTGPTDLVLLPDLDIGAGGGVYLGYRWHMNELLVMYSITEHDGDFDGSPMDHDSTFYELDLNWRHYFMEHSPIQPYGLLGVGWSRADIENGSTDQATLTVFEDAELLNGINVNVGVGVAVYTLPWVMFYGQAMYRFGRFKSSRGIDGKFNNEHDVDSDGWNLQAGAALRLSRGRKTLSRP